MNELANTVITTLKQRSVNLATAESLTGGLLGAALTEVPGASEVYLGGTIAYATRLKERLLLVPDDVVRAHTVVSEEVALAMAIGLQEQTDADWVIAVTGVAGPTGQDGHEPGEVWIGVVGPRIASLPQFQQVRRFDFVGDRGAVRAQTVDAAFSMLLQLLSPVA